MERPPSGPKSAPKLAHGSRVVVAMTRKKIAQAPCVLETMTVLSALIVNECFWLIAMVVGMCIVTHNGTELATVLGGLVLALSLSCSVFSAV